MLYWRMLIGGLVDAFTKPDKMLGAPSVLSGFLSAMYPEEGWAERKVYGWKK